MIRSITQPKGEEEMDLLLEGLTRLFIVGCGTCVTLTETGGAAQVDAMRERLLSKGKMVTGHTVVPVACDELSHEILGEQGEAIERRRGPGDHDLRVRRPDYRKPTSQNGDPRTWIHCLWAKNPLAVCSMRSASSAANASWAKPAGFAR